MDETLLKILIGLAGAALTAVVGAIGWFAKEFRDFLRMRREMLQNVPKRTLAILDKPYGCKWRYNPHGKQLTVEVQFEFLVTNITKLSISLANSTVTFAKRNVVVPVRVRLRVVDEHNHQEPQASLGEHAIPPGETYLGSLTFTVPAPVAFDQVLEATITICDQYGNRHRVKRKFHKVGEVINHPPPLPSVLPCGDGALVEERTRWRKTRRKVRGAVGFIQAQHGGNLVIAQVKFSAPITSCMPKVSGTGEDESPAYRPVAQNTAVVVHFEADATACKGDTVTSDVTLIDNYGREYKVFGMLFVRQSVSMGGSASTSTLGEFVADGKVADLDRHNTNAH